MELSFDRGRSPAVLPVVPWPRACSAGGLEKCQKTSGGRSGQLWQLTPSTPQREGGLWALYIMVNPAGAGGNRLYIEEPLFASLRCDAMRIRQEAIVAQRKECWRD